MGIQQASISHRLYVAASQNLRPIRPQFPPLVYCSINSVREPSVRPSQKMKAMSQECRNRSQFMNAPITVAAEKSAPTISVSCLHWEITAGGAKSAGVTRKVVLMAYHLPAIAGPWSRQEFWIYSLVEHSICFGLSEQDRRR